ncbi:hypothetical protein D9756_007177 [Leucocoprinus leucothites]|uniref:Uncharacterized protein n=1 Tax=Leucocoprinus leucothites TaxID=201217 RepID=A0A8H5D734_9AGAR|nr:hypothetical protein D9756_007177 [Leucoagaricus leucothites]
MPLGYLNRCLRSDVHSYLLDVGISQATWPANKLANAISVNTDVCACHDVAINFTRIIRGFIVNEGHTGDYYNVLAEFTQIFGSAMYIVQTFVGDGVAIYRCYIVWSRRLVFILFPCAIYIGSIVSGIGILVTMGKATAGSLVFLDELGDWISSFFALTLVTSTTCTLMIASRIWYLNNQSIRDGSRRKGGLNPIARVVVESGAIYSSMLIALLILYGQKSWFQYIIVDALSSLIGIVFSVIIVRIGLGIAIDPDTVQASTISSKTMGGSDRTNSAVHELSTFEAPGDPVVSTDRHWHSVKVNLETSGSSEHSTKHEKSAEGQV